MELPIVESQTRSVPSYTVYNIHVGMSHHLFGMSSRVTNNCWAKTLVSRIHLPRLQVKFPPFQKQEPKKLRLRGELSPQTLFIKRVSVDRTMEGRIPIGVQRISLSDDPDFASPDRD